MSSLVNQLGRYGLVGVLNTAITLATIWVCLGLGVGPLTSNALGYVLGLANSYVLNRTFTFNSSRWSPIEFAVAFAISYAGNLYVVYLSEALASFHAMLPHLLGMLTYNIIFFALMKVWVFAK